MNWYKFFVPARLEDRALVHGWMTTSGIVDRMMGPPTFPDVEVSNYDQFIRDWVEAYWTHATPGLGRGFLIERDGEQVGFIAHNDVVTTPDGERATELDMWLRSPEDTGHGTAPAAIEVLVEKLRKEDLVDLVFLQPSARNPNGIRAYEKAGFSRVGMDAEDAAEFYGTEEDYDDSVFMTRRL